MRLPIGGLTKFGSLTFVPDRTTKIAYKRQWVTAFAKIPGVTYPYDRYGSGPTPLSDYHITLTHTLLAPLGSSMLEGYIDLENQLKAIDDALTQVNPDSTCGLVDLISFNNADKTKWIQTLVRITDLDYNLEAGKTNRYVDINLSFMVLADWVIVEPG